MAQPPNPTATLLITCQDQPGLVAEVAHFIRKNGGNILHADQHHDHEQGIFFQRVEFETANFALPEREIPQAFEATAGAFGMDFAFRFSRDRPRVALLASKQPHCLYDLLSRFRHGDLRADVRLVVSNHPDHADVAAFFGIPFHHLPVTADTKEAQERALLSVLRQEDINLVVLARYMQILSEGFVDAFPHQIINIHHSFLPAFVGARPYHQAHARGVKV
ncbi:MAG: formyltetrahydrofolate deformylase, partial [Myxococcales bacterium]|nr:formyltetrahydrofolate deformylase [Myxococcales bacterium]